MNYRSLSGNTLAYIGDAVFELLVRKRLIDEGQTQPKALNIAARLYVKASAQSEALERLLPFLTEEEEELYKRGRNAHGVSAPKSADAVSYRRATGLEALFGMLYLEGRQERINELFTIAFPKNETIS